MSSTPFAQVAIGSVADVQSGYAFKSKDWRTAGIPVIKIANVKDGAVVLEGCSFVGPEVAQQASRYRLKLGDVLISMTGHIGEVAQVRTSEHLMLNQRVGRFEVVDPARLDQTYLFYALRQDSLKGEMQAHAYGVAQPNISPTLIKQLKIPLPRLDTQQRIVATLSAYDGLIENNTRRLQILEEIAQAIYREWFVNFRFPGHEDVEMVGSGIGPIPAGWRLTKLGDVVDLRYGKALKADERKHGQVPVFGSSGVVGYHDQAIVRGPGIIVGRKGNVGSVHWTEDGFYPIDAVFYVDTELPLHFTYFNLQLQNFISGDAAVPGLNRQQAYSLPMIVPSSPVLQRFETVVTPTFRILRNLRSANQNLRGTRDVLLPRLVSGELDVSDLDIETGELAA